MRYVIPLAAATMCLTAAACTPEYEYDRPGTWRLSGANDANLRAMVAYPQDLTAGRGSSTDRGNGPARAVTRLLTDRRRPLLNNAASRVGATVDSGPDTPLPDAPTGGGAPAAAPAGETK